MDVQRWAFKLSPPSAFNKRQSGRRLAVESSDQPSTVPLPSPPSFGILHWGLGVERWTFDVRRWTLDSFSGLALNSFILAFATLRPSAV